MATHDFVEERYLDYIENVLDPSERAAVDRHFETCQECQEGFKQYRALYLMEVGNDLAIPQLDESFTDDVMEALQTEVVPESIQTRSRRLISGLVATNVVLGLILIAMIGNRSSINLPQAGEPSMTLAALPEGYQRVALHLEPEVEPTRLRADEPMFVDLRVVYEVEGSTKIAEVLRFAKVESLHGIQAHTNGQPVLNVLVKDEDVERVNVARILGDLSVSMFTLARGESNVLRDPEGRYVEAPPAPLRSAVLYQKPDNTKIPVRKVFDQGAWREDPGVELMAF